MPYRGTPEYHLERFKTSSHRWFVWKTDKRYKAKRRLLGIFTTSNITNKLSSGKWK